MVEVRDVLGRMSTFERMQNSIFERKNIFFRFPQERLVRGKRDE